MMAYLTVCGMLSWKRTPDRSRVRGLSAAIRVVASRARNLLSTSVTRHTSVQCALK
jgi:hypothetical protein